MEKRSLVVSTFLVCLLLAFCFPAIGAQQIQKPHRDLGDSKITPIKGIVLLCKIQVSDDVCDDTFFGSYMNSASIRFVTRDHIMSIINEKSIKLSGLTDSQSDKIIGDVVGASHLLVYSIGNDNPDNPSKASVLLRLQLININTSEIEYSDSMDLSPRLKLKIDPIRIFFIILDRHSEKRLQGSAQGK